MKIKQKYSLMNRVKKQKYTNNNPPLPFEDFCLTTLQQINYFYGIGLGIFETINFVGWGNGKDRGQLVK